MFEKEKKNTIKENKIYYENKIPTKMIWKKSPFWCFIFTIKLNLLFNMEWQRNQCMKLYIYIMNANKQQPSPLLINVCAHADKNFNRIYLFSINLLITLLNSSAYRKWMLCFPSGNSKYLFFKRKNRRKQQRYYNNYTANRMLFGILFLSYYLLLCWNSVRIHYEHILKQIIMK